MDNANRLTGQMSESVVTATLLACVGGFLETYTFLLHGHVFANAQTGNIARGYRIANLIVSVVCAFQVQTFRKVQGTSYASTMCTGNLRSATVAWTTWRRTGLVEAKRQTLHYAGIIAVFLLGAAIGVPVIKLMHERAVVIPISLLIVTAGVMSLKPRGRK